MPTRASLEEVYRRRTAKQWWQRAIRLLEPPAPLVMNPAEPRDFPLGRWNLYIGGAGRRVEGYINLDLIPVPGVDLVADAGCLPFAADVFQRVECDAVLEHAQNPRALMGEIQRVLAPGGYAHIVTPFCHPFHEYPRDYWRFTPDGIKAMADSMEVVAEGWRTGPTATLLVFTLEHAKLLVPSRVWRALCHVVLGWLLFPLRYLDRLLFRFPDAHRIGNHCYVWLRKPPPARSTSATAT